MDSSNKPCEPLVFYQKKEVETGIMEDIFLNLK